MSFPPSDLPWLAHEAVHDLAAADLMIGPGRFRPPMTCDHPPATGRRFTDVAAALSWVRAECADLTTLCLRAGEQGLHESCWWLAFLLRDVYFLDKLREPWLRTHTAALAAATADGNTWAAAVTLNNLGIAHVDSGDLSTARSCYQKALAMFTALDDRHGWISATANLGWVHHYHGDHSVAIELLGRAARFHRRAGTSRNTAITLRGIALVEVELNANADAIAHAGEALAVFDDLGLRLDTAMTWNCLGWAHFRAGRHGQAESAYLRAVAIGQTAESAHEVARAETGLGNVAAIRGRTVDARRHWTTADGYGAKLSATTTGEVRARIDRIGHLSDRKP
ncbi:MAG TPA: tetratricopeptide repeat protein [Pseudonocardiaceae bacterium]|nr:tetratricopeptide repeat protein [Pseudonocardiaceae bacterium]